MPFLSVLFWDMCFLLYTLFLHKWYEFIDSVYLLWACVPTQLKINIM